MPPDTLWPPRAAESALTTTGRDMAAVLRRRQQGVAPISFKILLIQSERIVPRATRL